MAITDRNIVITPNRTAVGNVQPKIVFTGADSGIGDSSAITLFANPENSGTLSFSGTAGQLFSITNNLTGTIFSVNDISGIPSLSVNDQGIIQLAEFNGRVIIGDSIGSDDSVSASSIKTDAVTTAKVQNDAITVDKLNLISTSSVPSLEAKGDGSSQDGYIQLNCSQNSHGVKLKSPPHSANQSYTLTLPSTAPATDKILQTNSSGVLSFVDAPSGGLTLLSMIDQDLGTGNKIQFQQVFSSAYDYYKVIGSFNLGSTGAHTVEFRFLNSSNAEQTASEYYGVHKVGDIAIVQMIEVIGVIGEAQDLQ